MVRYAVQRCRSIPPPVLTDPPGSATRNPCRERAREDRDPQPRLEVEHQVQRPQREHGRCDDPGDPTRDGPPAVRDTPGEQHQRRRDRDRQQPEGPGGDAGVPPDEAQVDGRAAVGGESLQRVPGGEREHRAQSDHSETGEHPSAGSPQPGPGEGEQRQDQQDAGLDHQVPRLGARRLGRVRQQYQHEQGETGGHLTRTVADGRHVCGDSGEQGRDQQRPAAQVGPPRTEVDGLERPVPADEQQDQPAGQAQPAHGVRRDGEQPAQRHEEQHEHRDRDRAPDGGVLGEPCVGRADQSGPGAGDRLGAVQTPDGWLCAHTPTAMPSTRSAIPTSAPAPRQSRPSSPANPADRAPSRSRVSIPATISQNVSAAPRRSLRVTTTATDASSAVTPSSTSVRPVIPRALHATATNTTAATSRHSAPSESSTTGTEAAGSTRVRAGVAAGRGNAGRGPAGEGVDTGAEGAGDGVRPDRARSRSTTRSAATIRSHSSTARGPVTWRPQAVQVDAASSGLRQSGQMVGSTSRLMPTIVRARKALARRTSHSTRRE